MNKFKKFKCKIIRQFLSAVVFTNKFFGGLFKKTFSILIINSSVFIDFKVRTKFLCSFTTLDELAKLVCKKLSQMTSSSSSFCLANKIDSSLDDESFGLQPWLSQEHDDNYS